MGVTALVMAGGKGTRMKLQEEKPLLKVGGKPMIEHILNALKNASKVDEIVVAVSKHTPKTARTVKKLSVKILETPGKDFISDTKYAVKRLELSTVVTVSADLPLLSGEIVDRVIESYEQCGKTALAVVVPAETRERLGLKVDYVFEMRGRQLVPAGLNVIDARRIDEAELEEEKLVIDMEEIAVNVNRPEDLEIAERLFKRLFRWSPSTQ
ncbi:MAG: NTP transferase domain-containing protein [Candidatus Bathyarchaeota archaeon]|nr:NTP transferase domain-containing protein [Candidatus Bathyarchaeota archaeon]MDH5712683.1 NTP transferase domain-containing protein [Candidatus Bathyarchaeota archaeon]